MARPKTVTAPPESETTAPSGETKPAWDETQVQPDQVKLLPVSAIVRNPRNPRKHFDADKMKELVESVRERGVLQPILVRPTLSSVANNSREQAAAEALGIAELRYELVAGERRWRAAKEAGRPEILAVIRDLSDDEAFETSVIENSQREDVNPVDEAASFAAYLKQIRANDKNALEELARKIGHPVSYIRKRLALTAVGSAAWHSAPSASGSTSWAEPGAWAARKRPRKAMPTGIDAIVVARIREIVGESAGLDVAAVEEIVDRMIDRKLKDKFKALMG